MHHRATLKRVQCNALQKSAPTLKGIVNNDAAHLENAHDNLVRYTEK